MSFKSLVRKRQPLAQDNMLFWPHVLACIGEVVSAMRENILNAFYPMNTQTDNGYEQGEVCQCNTDEVIIN